MTMWRMASGLILIFVLSACQIIGGDDGGDSGGNAANTTPILIDWDRSPDAIVFRAEITGGDDSDAFYRRNEVPLCTIYGDNRVVWNINTEEGTQILFDRLNDRQIQAFVESLTLQFEIYTYEAGIDYELPTSTTPVYEQITLAVNDITHVTDSFSEWRDNLFQEVVDTCQSVSQSPIVFEPDSGWISVTEVPYDLGAPLVSWDAAGSGLNLAELATSGERLWIGDNERLLRVLWRLIRTSPPNLQFSQSEGVYQLALEVPNVHPTAPPAP